jgi:hypothetical protein
MLKINRLIVPLAFLLLVGCTEGQKPTPLKRTEPKMDQPAADKAKADKPGKSE